MVGDVPEKASRFHADGASACTLPRTDLGWDRVEMFSGARQSSVRGEHASELITMVYGRAFSAELLNSATPLPAAYRSQEGIDRRNGLLTGALTFAAPCVLLLPGLGLPSLPTR
jgi:hypothetical protein